MSSMFQDFSTSMNCEELDSDRHIWRFPRIHLRQVHLLSALAKLIITVPLGSFCLATATRLGHGSPVGAQHADDTTQRKSKQVMWDVGKPMFFSQKHPESNVAIRCIRNLSDSNDSNDSSKVDSNSYWIAALHILGRDSYGRQGTRCGQCGTSLLLKPPGEMTRVLDPLEIRSEKLVAVNSDQECFQCKSQFCCISWNSRAAMWKNLKVLEGFRGYNLQHLTTTEIWNDDWW